MIKYLLQQLEKSPNPLFSKKELSSFPQDFQNLYKRKIFVYFNPPEGCDERVREPRCPYGCALTVVEHDGEPEGICLDHSEEGPFPIEKDNLRRYLFSIDNFLKQIYMANKMNGNLRVIEDKYFYIGYKIYDETQVDIVFVHHIGKDKLVKLSGLKQICGDDNILVVFTPLSKIEDPVLKRGLGKDVIQAALVDYLNPETFELPIEKLISGILKQKAKEGRVVTELSNKQRADYKKFEYKCYDKVYIPGTTPMKRSNWISINEHEIKIPDYLFKLFLRFVLELNKNKGGWISKQDLKNEGFVPDADKHQFYDALKTPLEGSLLEKDGDKFIENDGSGRYRLSTHPEFIRYEKEALLKHPDSVIKEITKRLP